MSRQRVVPPMTLCLAATLAVSCGRPDAARTDSAVDSAAVGTVSSGEGEWAAELGTLLVVPSDSDDAAVVLFPAAPTPRLIASAPLALLNASGDSLTAKLVMTAADSQQCGDAPIVRLAGAVPPGWSVGLLSRTAGSIKMDSIGAMAAPDSVRFAADLARLASSLPRDRESRFTALPFVVVDGRRFVSDGAEIVVGHLVRRLPQEATPLEERTLVVGQRPAGAGNTARYDVAYHEHSEGPEETAEHFEMLAAVHGSQSTLLLIARDQDARTVYEVLERPRESGAGWRMRWRRVLAC